MEDFEIQGTNWRKFWDTMDNFKTFFLNISLSPAFDDLIPILGKYESSDQEEGPSNKSPSLPPILYTFSNILEHFYVEHMVLKTLKLFI